MFFQLPSVGSRYKNALRSACCIFAILICSCTAQTSILLEASHKPSIAPKRVVGLRFFLGVQTADDSTWFVGLDDQSREPIPLGIDRDLVAAPYRLLVRPGIQESRTFIVAVAGLDERRDLVGFGYLTDLIAFSAGDVHHWKVMLTSDLDEVVISDTGCVRFPKDGQDVVIASPNDTDCDGNEDADCPNCQTSTKVYWTDYDVDEIQVAGKGGEVELPVIRTGLDVTYGLAFDRIHNRLYWTDYGTDRVECSGPDGGDRHGIDVNGRPRGIAVDPFGEKVYWADSGDGLIWRANLDLTGIEPWIENLVDPYDIDLDLAAGKIYWADDDDGTVNRINLDGTGNIETLHSQLNEPRGVSVDPLRNILYWTELGGPISYSNLDGSNPVVDIVAGTIGPQSIEVDIIGAKIYWVDAGTDSLMSAELDGTLPTVLVPNLSTPRGIALGN